MDRLTHEGRIFDRGIPAEHTCSACGSANPRYFDMVTTEMFCDRSCFVDWFHENEAIKVARAEADERLYELLSE